MHVITNDDVLALMGSTPPEDEAKADRYWLAFRQRVISARGADFASDLDLIPRPTIGSFMVGYYESVKRLNKANTPPALYSVGGKLVTLEEIEAMKGGK